MRAGLAGGAGASSPREKTLSSTTRCVSGDRSPCLVRISPPTTTLIVRRVAKSRAGRSIGAYLGRSIYEVGVTGCNLLRQAITSLGSPNPNYMGIVMRNTSRKSTQCVMTLLRGWMCLIPSAAHAQEQGDAVVIGREITLFSPTLQEERTVFVRVPEPRQPSCSTRVVARNAHDFRPGEEHEFCQ